MIKGITPQQFVTNLQHLYGGSFKADLWTRITVLYTNYELERIWEYVLRNPPDIRPKPNRIKYIADSIGIYKEWKFEVVKWYYKCKCGAKFSVSSGGCYKCQKGIHTNCATLIKDSKYPKDYVNLKSDCWKCKKLNNNTVNNCYAFCCEDFGIKIQSKQCNDCVCKDECCLPEIEIKRKMKEIEE